MIVKSKFDAGRRIHSERPTKGDSKEMVNSRGWSGHLGKLMERLAKDLDMRTKELYNCLNFAKHFKSWDEFSDTEFLIARRPRQAISVRVQSLKGKELTWQEVKRQVLPSNQKQTTSRRVSCVIDDSAYEQLKQEGLLEYGAGFAIRKILEKIKSTPELLDKVKEEIERRKEEDRRLSK